MPGFGFGIGFGVQSGSVLNQNEPETDALIARFATAPDATEITILNEFIKDLKVAGVFAKADVITALDGSVEANSLLNIVKDAHNFTKGTTPVFTANKGWKGDGVGVLNTNFNPSESGDKFDETGSFSYGGFYYNMGYRAASSLGARNGSTKQLYTNERNSNDTVRVYHTATNTTSSASTNRMKCGLVMIDISGGSLRIFINGKLIQTVASITIASMPEYNMYVFGINSAGTILGPTERTASNIFIGASMSEAEHLAFFNACIKKFYSKSGDDFNTNLFLADFNKASKTLHKVAILGSSVMANGNLAGDIPVEFDEGDKYRPLRLTHNTVARRIYDLMSWNKANHIRLDATEFTKSGTWTAVNDTTVFEPIYDNETYHESTEANAYVEITVPDGKENFSFICAKDASFDTLAITLNGGSIAAYGAATVDCARARLHASDIGNHYFTVTYEGLPAGANVIRIAKGNNTNKVRIWGGFYWSGNTLIVQNVAHNGHTMQDLINQHLDAEITGNAFDHVMFQITLGNEIANEISVAGSVTYLNTILTTYLHETNLLITDCHPFGIDPANPETNYYADWTDPTMEEYTIFYKLKCWDEIRSFVNVFNSFKKQIIADGGSLIGGEAGLTYTTDGMHLSPAGNAKWMEILTPIFSKIND